MKTHVLVLAAVSCALLLLGAAGADAIPFSYSRHGVAVSGAFFGSDYRDGSWTMTPTRATYNQIEASGIVAVGLDPYFLCNNLYDDSSDESTQVSQSSFGPAISEPAKLTLFRGGLVAQGEAARRGLWGYEFAGPGSQGAATSR